MDSIRAHPTTGVAGTQANSVCLYKPCLVGGERAQATASPQIITALFRKLGRVFASNAIPTLLAHP